MENVISNAERRTIREGSDFVVPRVADIYAAMPSITGKLELEYEGEMKGADTVARELIRAAIARSFDKYFGNGDLKQVVQWFELGGEIQLAETAPNADVLQGLQNIQGLMEKTSDLKLPEDKRPEVQISAAEFILEGLHAHKRIGRSEERVFSAGEKAPKRGTEREYRREELDEELDFRRKNRRPFN
jgi:magnesium chelatase subunit I